jgi:hypothetical protein
MKLDPTLRQTRPTGEHSGGEEIQNCRTPQKYKILRSFEEALTGEATFSKDFTEDQITVYH